MTKKNIPKNEGGRPSKIHAFIKVFEEQMNIDTIKEQVIYLTDAELVFLINELLPEEDRITDMTFRRWKAKEMGEPIEGVEELDEVGRRFCSLYKKALIQMKAALFNKMLDKTQISWQKYAWILERKFTEWNIRQIGDQQEDQTAQKRITIIKNYKKE